MLLRFGDPDFNQDWLALLEKDPVHPHISVNDRTHDGRTVFALERDGIPSAMICAKLSAKINQTIADILTPDTEQLVAMFYTVFRLPGAAGGVGCDIINEVLDYCKSKGVKEFYTLSPIPSLTKHFVSVPTESEVVEYLESKKDPVARFHLGNGAKIYAINFDADASEIRQNESWGIMVNYNYTT